MPRCQRTFHRLSSPISGGHGANGCGPVRWVCPHCPGAEVYEAVGETDLLQYARLAEAACIQDFGRPSDAARATFLLLGLRPECVLESADRRYEIYLQRGSDALQMRLQLGHELFHRTCSQGRIFHWTHEMLACLFSVRLLRQQGFEAYADQMSGQYRSEAQACPPGDFFAADLWTLTAYPEGYYGLAYTLGRALKTIVGWPALCRLTRSCGEPGSPPNVKGWLAALPSRERAECEFLLAPSLAADRTPRYG
ncbi:MAG: hypothetical protein H7Z41_09715 [Cytophagales bacterium]|nr:hypothetical protein [Armatimonadota bacterium]